MFKEQEHVDSLSKMDGVMAVLLIHRDGEILEMAKSEDVDVDYIASISHKCITQGYQIQEMLNRESLKSSFLEFDDSNLTLEVLKDESILALMATAKANLGRIRLEVRKAKTVIEEGLP